MSTTPTADDQPPSFTIIREFAAGRDRIWQAWTDPESMAAWFHPETLITPRESVHVDLRVGGRYAYTMVDEDAGIDYPTAGTYLVVDPPRRLDFTWGSPGEEDDAPVVSVGLDELGPDRTRMTFTVTGIGDDSGRDDSAYDGWNSAFAVLDEELAG